MSIFSKLAKSITGDGVLGAASSIFGGYMGYKGVKEMNKANLQIARETNQANRANQEYQNEWNLNMWNQQNAYNDPSQQRKRLEDAGLNPLFYGLDGTGNAGALTSADFVATPGAPMANSGQFLGEGIANAMKTMAEIDLMQSQKDKTDADTKGVITANEIMQAQKDDLIKLPGVEIRMKEAGATMSEEAAKLTAAQATFVKEQTPLLREEFNLLRDRYNLDKDRLDFDKDVFEKQFKLESQRIACQFYIDLMNAQTARDTYYINKTLAKYQAAKLQEEAKLTKQQTETESFETVLAEKRSRLGTSVKDPVFLDTAAQNGARLLDGALEASGNVLNNFNQTAYELSTDPEKRAEFILQNPASAAVAIGFSFATQPNAWR